MGSNRSGWKRRTATLAGWVAGVVALLVAAFAGVVEIAGQTQFIGIPASVLLSTIVAPAVLVSLSFWFAARQQAIDRSHDTSD